MKQIIDWLSAHKFFNLLLLFAYYIAVVLPHKQFGTFLNQKVFKGITRAEYNQMVLTGGLILLFCYLFIFVKNTWQLESKNKLWIYMAVNIVLSALVLNFLFVINIEVVHYPQYALFAVLCFPLLRNFQQTLIWTTIAGAIDEAHQYFYLAPKDTSYYDFNDVVTNLVGAVFGLLLIRGFDILSTRHKPFHQSTAFYGLVALGVIIIGTLLTGTLSIYPSEDTTYQLLRKFPEGFWSKANPNVVYHIMQPLEGTIVTILLWLGFRGIGK